MRRGLDSGCIFKVEPTGFASELDQEIRESQALGLSSGKNGVATLGTCMGEGETRGSVWDVLCLTWG